MTRIKSEQQLDNHINENDDDKSRSNFDFFNDSCTEMDRILEEDLPSEHGKSQTNLDTNSILGIQIVLPNGKKMNGFQTSDISEMTSIIGKSDNNKKQIIDDFSSMGGFSMKSPANRTGTYNNMDSQSQNNPLSAFNFHGGI